MDSNQVEGVIREGVGRVQDGVGGLTGDAKVQLEGKGNQLAGAAQRTLGDLKDKAGELAGSAGAKAQDLYASADGFARERPLATLGFGVLLGIGLGIAVGAQLASQSRTVYFRR